MFWVTSSFSEKIKKLSKINTSLGAVRFVKVKKWFTNKLGSLKRWIIIPLNGVLGLLKFCNASLVSCGSILFKTIAFPFEKLILLTSLTASNKIVSSSLMLLIPLKFWRLFWNNAKSSNVNETTVWALVGVTFAISFFCGFKPLKTDINWGTESFVNTTPEAVNASGNTSMLSAAQDPKLNNIWFAKISFAGINAVKSCWLLRAVIFLKIALFSFFPLRIFANVFFEFDAKNILSSTVVKIACLLIITFWNVKELNELFSMVWSAMESKLNRSLLSLVIKVKAGSSFPSEIHSMLFELGCKCLKISLFLR